MVGGVIYERTDERNPQATDLTLGHVHREVWSWPGEHIEGDTRIDELNRKMPCLILCAADFHLATAIGIGVETNIRQGLFNSEFDLHDTLGCKARRSGTLHHQRETAWQRVYASRECQSGHRRHLDLCDPSVTELPHSAPL
jgi:hypothetical protein